MASFAGQTPGPTPAPAPALPSAPTGPAHQNSGPQANRPPSAGPNIRTVDAAPGARRNKKRKLPDRFVYEKVARIIPESLLFMRLVSAEQRLDTLIQRRRSQVHESLGTPLHLKKRLRLYIFNTHYNQHAQVAMEPGSWCLSLYGRVVDRNEGPAALNPENPQLRPPSRPNTLHFTNVLKRLEVTFTNIGLSSGPIPLPPPPGVVWERSKHTGEHHDSLEVRRVGSFPVEAHIRLEVDWQPDRWMLPPALAKALGVQYDTRARIQRALWDYVKGQKLQSNSNPSMLECNECLATVFGEKTITLASLGERLAAALKPMPPLEFSYKIRLTGPSPCHPECIDIDIEVPAEPLQDSRLAPFLERVAKDREIEQVEQRVAAAQAKVSEHRRRRAFFLGFSQSPVDFINALIASQARDLRVAKSGSTREFEVERNSAVFSGRWVEDAVMRYLNSKLQSGQ